jgi:hypothetical protein
LSETLEAIRHLVSLGKVRISEHGYDELAADGLYATDLIAGVAAARLVEDYPTFPKGPAVLVLQVNPDNQPIHAVWGIPAGATEPAVLVTAYRPDPKLWDNVFLRRRP